MIRRATVEDLPPLLDIGRRFVDYNPSGLPFSAERTAMVLEGIIVSGAGVVFVGDVDGRITGVIVGMRTPLWYSDVEVASELALWVEPDRRGGSLARNLIIEFEGWASAQGLHHVSMSDLCIRGSYPAGVLFERHDYRVTERFHLKEI